MRRLWGVVILLTLVRTFLSHMGFSPADWLSPILYVAAFILVFYCVRRFMRLLYPPATRGGSEVLIGAMEGGIGRLVSRGTLRSFAIGAIRATSGNTSSSDCLAFGPPQALDANSVLEGASITKGITGLLLADLVQSGIVALEDSISKYLPVSGLDNVTLEHLATHRSGQPKLPGSMVLAGLVGSAQPYRYWTRERLLRATRPSSPTEQPHYSNLGFALLGQALAAACGTEYEELAQNRILDPLGMDASGFNSPTSLLGHDLLGLPTPSWKMAAFTPAGGLKTSISDLNKLITSMLAAPAGPLGDAWALATSPRVAFSPTQQIGLGWLINGAGTVWHNGGTFGSYAWVGANRDLGTGLALLAPSSSLWSRRYDVAVLTTMRLWAGTQ